MTSLPTSPPTQSSWVSVGEFHWHSEPTDDGEDRPATPPRWSGGGSGSQSSGHCQARSASARCSPGAARSPERSGGWREAPPPPPTWEVRTQDSAPREQLLLAAGSESSGASQPLESCSRLDSGERERVGLSQLDCNPLQYLIGHHRYDNTTNSWSATCWLENTLTLHSSHWHWAVSDTIVYHQISMKFTEESRLALICS